MNKSLKKKNNLSIKGNNLTEDNIPYLHWKYKYNEESNKMVLNNIELSDQTELTELGMQRALKASSGTTDLNIGERILKKVSQGLSGEGIENRINDTTMLLASLRPQDSTEALLLGQFLALNDNGMKCLKFANQSEQGFFHIEKLLAMSTKLFNIANQTIQTLLKYRSKGQQTIQVVHLHNEGQAIVTQNLSSTSPDGVRERKLKLNPMDQNGSVYSKK